MADPNQTTSDHTTPPSVNKSRSKSSGSKGGSNNRSRRSSRDKKKSLESSSSKPAKNEKNSSSKAALPTSDSSSRKKKSSNRQNRIHDDSNIMIMNKKVSSPGRIKASSSFDKKQSSSSSSSSSAKKKASSSKTSTNNDPNKKSSQKRQSKSAETTRLLREEEPSKKETGAQGGSCSSLLTEEENNWPIKKPSSASKIDGKQQRGRNAPSRSRSRSTDKKKKLGNNRSQSADNALTIRPSSTTTRNRSKSDDKKVIRKEKPSSATGKTTHPRKEEEKLASHIIPPEDDESSSCSSSSSSGASVEQPSSSEDDGCDDSKPGVSSVAMTFMLKKQGLPTSNVKPDSSHRKRTETSNIFQKESKIVPDNSKKIIKIVNGKVVKILEDYSTEHEDEASKRSPTKTIASNREDNQQTIPLPSSPDRSMSRSPQGSRRSPDSPQSPDIFAPAKSPPRSTTRVMTLADMAALHSDSDESSSSDGEGEATQKSRKIKFVAQKQFLKTEKWTKKEEDLSRKKISKDQSRAKTTAKEKKPEIIPGHQNEHSSSTKETAEFEDITDPAKNKPTISMWEMREIQKKIPTEPAILRQLYKEEKMAEYERQERFRRDNAKEPVRSDDVLKLLYPPQKKNNCAALFVDKEVRGNELKVEASQPVQLGKEALLHRQDSELTFATTGPWEDYGSSGNKNEKKKDTFVGTMLLVTEEEEEEQHGGDVDKRHKSSWQSMAISAFCDKDKRKSNSNDWGGNSSFSGPTGNRKSRDGQQRSVKASQQSSPDLAWDGNFHRSFSAGAAKESNQGPAFEAAFDNIGDLEFDGFKIKTHTATEIMQNNVQPEKKTWYEVDLPRRGGGDDESGIISHEPRLEDIRKRHRRTADRTGRDRSIERSRHNVDRSGHSLDRSGHGRLRRDKSRERSRQDAMHSSSGHLSAHFRSNRWGERRQKDGESSVHSSRSKDTSIRRNHRTLDSSSSHGRRKEPTRGIGRAKSEEQVAKYSSRAQENSFGHYFAGGLENFIADSQHPSSAPQNDRFSMDRMSQPGPSKEISIVQAPKTPVLQPSTRERRRARSFDNLKVVMDLEGPNVDESAARRMLRTPGAPTIPGARSKQGVYAPAGTPNGRSRGNATAATNWMAEIPGAFAPLQKPAAFELVVANSNEPVSPLTVATRVARPNISARRRGVPY